ncbi:MAG: flavodoxin family protein [Deltaproteobacteria bacterium]|jgi:multimeric flavodoxin WrbA|nr:flavodoxin family protein [Deltaproteobacteria bacterium]
MISSSGVKILGLHLSPRKEGSSALLLTKFAEGAQDAGAKLDILSIADLDVKGCQACGGCSKNGVCIIDFDDMNQIYEAWETYERIVIASSVFFYDLPSQGKAVLDRSQAFWSRRYVLGMHKDGKPNTKGFLLTVGATKGKDLFVPITLAVKYMFDAIAFPKSFPVLAFRKIENPESFSQEQLLEAKKAGYEFAKS